MKHLIPFLALTALFTSAFAWSADSAINQEVRTNKHRFTSNGLVLSADGKALLDHSDVEPDGEDPSSASIKIVSAIGPIVSAYVEFESCGATCETSQNIVAYRASGGEVSLRSLVNEAGLLQALKNDPYLAQIFRSAGGDAERNFHGARDLDTVLKLLFDGVQTSEAFIVLGDEQLTSFAVYDYDVEKNQLIVRVLLQEESSDDYWAGPVLGLALTPNPDFAQDLRAAKLKGEGLFQRKPVASRFAPRS